MVGTASQPILTLANALRSGELPILDYLDQLEVRFSEIEPAIHSFLPEEDRFGRLRRDALALVERFPQPVTRPPLFGLPFGIKDIFRIDGFETLAGSKLPAATFAGREARSIMKLKSAGALIMGKTVTTEFAYFDPGPARNPPPDFAR